MPDRNGARVRRADDDVVEQAQRRRRVDVGRAVERGERGREVQPGEDLAVALRLASAERDLLVVGLVAGDTLRRAVRTKLELQRVAAEHGPALGVMQDRLALVVPTDMVQGQPRAKSRKPRHTAP